MEIWGDFSLRLSQVVLFWTSSYVSFQHTHAQFLSGIYLAMELLGYNVWEYLALISPVQFSRSVVSDSVTRGLQAWRASLSFTNSWSLPKLMSIESVMLPDHSSSVIPFSSCLQSFPASGSLSVSLFFASGGQSIEVSASAWVLAVNTQDWSPLGRTGWISLQSKRISRVFSNTTVQKHQFFGAQLALIDNAKLLKLCLFLNIIKMVLYSMLLCVWLLFFQCNVCEIHPGCCLQEKLSFLFPRFAIVCLSQCSSPSLCVCVQPPPEGGCPQALCSADSGASSLTHVCRWAAVLSAPSLRPAVRVLGYL